MTHVLLLHFKPNKTEIIYLISLMKQKKCRIVSNLKIVRSIVEIK